MTNLPEEEVRKMVAVALVRMDALYEDTRELIDTIRLRLATESR